MEAVRCSSRPGSLERRVGCHKLPIDELVRRYEHGLDLWSGEPLEELDADDWLRLECSTHSSGWEVRSEAELYKAVRELVAATIWQFGN